MTVFRMLKKFFSNMSCCQCQNIFDESSISVLREEENCVVIRMICSSCDKNLGLALMGFDHNLKLTEGETAYSEICAMNKSEDGETEDKIPISYDDVIDAHKFFYELDKDWIKHLEKRKTED